MHDKNDILKVTMEHIYPPVTSDPYPAEILITKLNITFSYEF